TRMLLGVERCVLSRRCDFFLECCELCNRRCLKLPQSFESNMRFFEILFVLLNLPVAAGREIVLVCFHLVFRYPELTPELVDFSLQRSDTRLELGEFGFRLFTSRAGSVGIPI